MFMWKSYVRLCLEKADWKKTRALSKFKESYKLTVNSTKKFFVIRQENYIQTLPEKKKKKKNPIINILV